MDTYQVFGLVALVSSVPFMARIANSFYLKVKAINTIEQSLADALEKCDIDKDWKKFQDLNRAKSTLEGHGVSLKPFDYCPGFSLRIKILTFEDERQVVDVAKRYDLKGHDIFSRYFNRTI